MPESEKREPVTNQPAGSAAAAGQPAAAATENASSDDTQFTELANQLSATKAEAAANYDKFMRAAADLENFRRRTVREKEELRTTATGRVLEDIFPVLDNLSLAIAAAKQPGAELKALVGGVEMVLAQLKTALGTHGMKEINPAVGDAFDPHQHESISHQPSSEVPEERVLQVVRTGYSLNGRLLRPASVVLSSGATKEAKTS